MSRLLEGLVVVGKGETVALRIVVEISEDVSTEAGRAEAVRLIQQVANRIGDGGSGAVKGQIANGNPVRSRAEWSVSEVVTAGKRKA